MLMPWLLNSEFYKQLSTFDEPNTLYTFMESIVNYDKEDDEKVKIKDLSKYARTTIFDFEYPLTNLITKEDFECMFLNHYMFRRINYDTLTSFKIHLQVKLNDIMPKYNKMFEGFNKIKFDGVKETHTRELTNESNITSNSSDSSESEVKYSDTPEGMLNEVKDGTYMSEFTYNTGSSEGETTSNSTGNTEESIEIIKGDSIEEYQKFIEISNNIYSLIFKECDCLFYGLIN